MQFTIMRQYWWKYQPHPGKSERGHYEKGKLEQDERTVFVSSDRDGVRRWSVANAGSCQYPDPVLCPPLQFIDNEWRCVQFHFRRLWVGTPGFDDVQLVVDDAAITPLSRWRLPGHSNRRGPLGYSTHILWRGTWHWKYPPRRANITIILPKYNN